MIYQKIIEMAVNALGSLPNSFVGHQSFSLGPNQ